MENPTPSKPLLGADNNALVAILGINLLVVALMGFLKIIYYLNSLPLEDFYSQVFHVFTLSPSATTFYTNPWTLFTFNWIHDGFWSVFTPMIWFVFFADILQNNQCNKHLFPIYFYSGLLTGIFYVVLSAFTILPHPLMGAHFSIISIAASIFIICPRYRIFQTIKGGIPVLFLVAFYLLLQAIFLSTAHWSDILFSLIAIATGIFYGLLLKNGKDLGNWMHNLLHWINKSASPK